MVALRRAPRLLLRRIADRMPNEIRVGDEWQDIPSDGSRIRVERIDDDEDLPFPMVHYARLDGAEDLDPRMGAPMFMWGKLVTRGAGAAWRPPR